MLNHKQEVITFLNIHKIDILLISESHFTNLTVFKIPHYNVYNTPHPDGTAHGGTTLIIRNTISHYELPQYQTNKIQATIVEVNTMPWRFTVAAIYSPPRHNISTDEYKDFLQTLGNRFIVGGDWNAKHTQWGSRLTTSKGRNLWRAMRDSNYDYISNGAPTYWPTDPRKLPDLLDFFVSHGLHRNNYLIHSNYDLSSDHTPVIVSLSTAAINKPLPPKLTTRNTDWNAFQNYLDENTNLNIRLKSPPDLDDAAHYFTTLVQKAAWFSTPAQEQQATIIPNTPLHIRQLVAAKRRARRVWQRSRHANDQHQYNRLSRQLKTALQELHNNSFEHYITHLSPTDNTLWKATKQLRCPQAPVPPIRKPNNEWARSDKDKACVFATHLADVFRAEQGHTDDDVEDFITAPCQMSPPIRAFTPTEVKAELTRLNSRKAPGYDLITGQILKRLPRKTIVLLTVVFNRMLTLSYFPVLWKYAEIIMIPKPGKPPHEPTSYRPISLLPITSKLFERLLLLRINEEHDPSTLLPSHQFGFRERHSTIHQVHRVVNKIATSLEEKKYCNAVFLDISQAFDRIWHPGLLFKLKQTLTSNYYLLLKSYLADRNFAVRHNNTLSGHYPIEAGVPQGSVLGPLLFLIFTADIPKAENTTIASFADDVAVLSVNEDPVSATRHLQTYLNALAEWYTRWRIKVNQAKSVQVTFTTRQNTCPPLTFNNAPIPVATEVKYLGLHLDQRLTWHTHIRAKRRQLDIKFRQMHWLLGRHSKLSLNNKLLLYKVVLKPIWSYGVQLWGCAKPTRLKIIQRFQSKLLRTVVNAPWYVSNQLLHNDLHMPSITEEIQRAVTKYNMKTYNHANDLIEHLYNNGPIDRRLRRTWPADLLQRRHDIP